jgi:hypothetical protein
MNLSPGFGGRQDKGSGIVEDEVYREFYPWFVVGDGEITSGHATTSPAPVFYPARGRAINVLSTYILERFQLRIKVTLL